MRNSTSSDWTSNINLTISGFYIILRFCEQLNSSVLTIQLNGFSWLKHFKIRINTVFVIWSGKSFPKIKRKNLLKCIYAKSILLGVRWEILFTSTKYSISSGV